MLGWVWSEMYQPLCASASRLGLGDIYPAFLCAFSLYRSVSAVCASTTLQSMNPHLDPDCRFEQSFAVVPRSRPRFDPVLAFWLHSGEEVEKRIKQTVSLEQKWHQLSPPLR